MEEITTEKLLSIASDTCGREPTATDSEFYEALKQYVQSELKKERERIVEIIKSNGKGSFTDDAGNDGWYIEDLINLLTK